jgi:hypothetical protein
MTLEADRDALVAAAAGWDGVADEVVAAQMLLWDGYSQGAQFGWFATRAGIDTQHDQFINSMIDAMSTGSAKIRTIAEALRSTAEDFGATDTSVADEFHNPDGTPR